MISRSARLGRLRIATGAVSAVGALMAGLVWAPPVSAAQPAGHHSVGSGHGTHVSYLALGDSIAFGYTPPQVTPPQAYQDAANFVGYPKDVAVAADVVLTNASCPGETTGSMISPDAISNGCENSPTSSVGYRDVYPLHVSYSDTQLRFAVAFLRSHPHTRLVTIDIGANDAFVCQETTPDQCTGSDFVQTLHKISVNLTRIYAALRWRAHYHHALVALTYYPLDYSDPAQVAQAKALNAAIAWPTVVAGGIIADGFRAFQRSSAPFGGDPCKAGLLIPLPGGGCNVHPTRKGHAVLARAIEAALTRTHRHRFGERPARSAMSPAGQG
ncbi:MAG: SGNH/GDSL hydrolase family protein [Streptosporangiaceae bacterium]